MTLLDNTRPFRVHNGGSGTRISWSTDNAAPKDPRIRRALELLQCHPATVAEIAGELNLSLSRLRHLFKNEVGISPSHYLALTRLERANQLLKNSFLRVKEVAALVGANDLSHFVRSYKAHYGQTPSETREFNRLPR